MWDSLAAERGVTLSMRGLESASCVALDGALEQIVDNYIDNALTVAPDHSRIEIEVRREQNHVVIDVIDQGPGLSDEQRLLAFERFWRGSHSENAEGTGLGLAIVRQLAIASGGTAELVARSDSQNGIVARVTLLAR
jgi:signal transduction histidine kinase